VIHWFPVLMVTLAVTLFAALIVALVAAARAQDRRYRSGLLDWAKARGWTYHDGGGGEWTSLLPTGDGQWGVKVQLNGTRQSRPVTVAHYWYETTSTDRDKEGHYRTSTTTHYLAVIAVRLPARYPAVALQRRGLGWGWGLAVSRAVGRQPGNLTGTEEFDRRYRIRGGIALVTPQVISAYLASDLPPWQLRGDQLVITWPGAIRVGDLDQKVDQALTVAGLLDSPATQP
jgi:hypothetical protein